MSEFTRPLLYPKQEAAIFCPERFAAIEASTKSGKTVGSIAWIVERAFAYKPGQNAWWVAPVFPQADIAYRRIKQSLTKGSFTAFASPQPRIELMTGGTIWIKSADNPDSLYGEDVYDAVMDEASRAKEEAWNALRSTLTATRGSARLIGNVKGRKNFFYALARKAEKKDLPGWHYAKITVLDAVDAGVLDKDEIDAARRELPEQVFRELYMAEPADDGGNPFGLDHIAQCIAPLSTNPVVAWGVDLAKKQDYLVLIGLDHSGHTSAFHRWRNVPWRDSIRRIHSIIGEDTPTLVDSTGVGDPVLEELQYEHGNFSGYNFGLASKQKLMEGLSVSIQGHEITFPAGPIQQELESYEYELTRTGVRYSAPEGYYDDCVCSLALARQMWTETAPGQNMIQFYQSMTAKQRKLEEKLPTENVRPWLPEPDPQIDLDKELNELYEETLRANLPAVDHNCHRCNMPVVGPSRVTDGEFIWHSACTTRTAA